MGEDMFICKPGILRGTFVSGSLLWEPQISLPCCSPLNKNMCHFSFFQVSFLLISEAFTNITPSYQSKLVMEFGVGERRVGREVDFLERKYILCFLLSQSLIFHPEKNTLHLKKILNNIIFLKNQRMRIELISNFEFHL